MIYYFLKLEKIVSVVPSEVSPDTNSGVDCEIMYSVIPKDEFEMNPPDQESFKSVTVLSELSQDHLLSIREDINWICEDLFKEASKKIKSK